MTAVAVSPDVAALAEQVRLARGDRTGLRVVGAGTWLDGGRPCDAATRLDVGSLHGVVAYEPGDLTLTARAGTALADIERITAAEGQWLPLQPAGDRLGTLGATVATASSGPLASAFGTPRDQVLGCTFINGAGEVIQAGGRVVKNVAGFDLVRLVTGAWGTLGALTEITVRLRARPEAEHSIAVEMPFDARDSGIRAWQWLRQSDYTPYAAEVISPTLARMLDIGTDGCLLLRVAGNQTFVRAAEDDAGTLGASRRLPPDVWSRLSQAEPANAITFRLSVLPSRGAELWSRASTLAERLGGYAHATLSRGVVRCVVPLPDSEPAGAGLVDAVGELARGCTMVGESLPMPLWDLVAQRRPNARLAARVRSAFDPDGILNPGIMGNEA